MRALFTIAFFLSHYLSYGQSSIPEDYYVILPFTKSTYTSTPDHAVPAALVDSDFKIIDRILSKSVDQYNQSQKVAYDQMNLKYPERRLALRNIVIDLKRYYRQYIVFKNSKREKEVWVNCFCSIQDMDYWRKDIVKVKDGGNCFFNVRINLTGETFADFMVNGEA